MMEFRWNSLVHTGFTASHAGVGPDLMTCYDARYHWDCSLRCVEALYFTGRLSFFDAVRSAAGILLARYRAVGMTWVFPGQTLRRHFGSHIRTVRVGAVCPPLQTMLFARQARLFHGTHSFNNSFYKSVFFTFEFTNLYSRHLAFFERKHSKIHYI